MKELVFALQFKGKATPAEGVEGKLLAKTSAAGQVHQTLVTDTGIDVKIKSQPGPRCSFESEVQITSPGVFLESGRIRYGKGASVTFKSVGHGIMGPSGIEGLMRGAVMWEITGGTGAYEGATGLITSNFTVGAKGEVVDNHFVRMFLPR